MISVVIPVHNTGMYLDRCLDSIVNQTYSELEVIIVDDHSNDETKRKEDEWIIKDSRVRRIESPKRGAGAARTIGYKSGSGEYLAFIDSDDWWDHSILEKLLLCIEKNDAEICTCDRFHVGFDGEGNITGIRKIISPFSIDSSESVSENPEIINMVEISLNGKLFKMSLLKENGIDIPDCIGEDRVIVPYLLYKAKKITRVREALYFYHEGRTGNTVNNIDAYKSLPECIKKMYEIFADEDQNDEMIRARQVSSMDAVCFGLNMINNLSSDRDSKEDKKNKQLLKRKIVDVNKNIYEEPFRKSYIWGSYNLRREVYLAYHSYIDNRIHQQYSSIIGLNSGKLNLVPPKTGDCNKDLWIERDFKKNFFEKIENDPNDYLIIDFLEERYPSAYYGDCLFTKSNILNIPETGDDNLKIIEPCSAESDSLWRNACITFSNTIKEKFNNDRIILVKNYLCSYHGEYYPRSLFINQDYIKKTNKNLEDYYSFFENLNPGISVIENLSELPCFYSDEYFPFGCAPHHVNDCFYHLVAEKIRKCLFHW